MSHWTNVLARHFVRHFRQMATSEHVHGSNGVTILIKWASLPSTSILVHSNSYPLLEHSPLSLAAIGSSPIINSMARLKKTPREEAASEANKKSAVLKRIYGERVTQPASSAAAATRGTGANSSETPQAEEGAASMVPTRLSARSRKAPAFLGDFSQSPGRRSHVPGQANRSDGDNGLAPPKPSDVHQSARSGNIPDTAVGNIPDTAVEEGTVDGDEVAAGGDKLIASGGDPDYEKSDSKDDEEIPDEEEAAEEIADEVLESANGDEDAGGDKYIASDDDPDYEKSESEDEEEIDEEAPPL
jgi:hypothetical protein